MATRNEDGAGAVATKEGRAGGKKREKKTGVADKVAMSGPAANRDSGDGSAGMKRKLTILAGIGIPLLALVLSHIAGKLFAADQRLLALWSLALCCTVLSVSLPHLATAIAGITRSEMRAAWALAVSIDLTLVLCETVAVSCPEAVSGWATYTTMAAVTAMSMVLNCWAFLHESEKH